MKKILLISAAILALTLPASAATVTGTYTVGISANSHATLTDTGVLSLTANGARQNFITVNPQACSYCTTINATLTVQFFNLTVNGHNFGGFTETGIYHANYGNQTDNVIWAGAVANNGPWVGLDQDNTVPLVFTDTINGGVFGNLLINMIDGSDWNVQTYIEAQAVPSTPIPAAVWLFGSALGGGALMLRRRKKKAVVAAA